MKFTKRNEIHAPAGRCPVLIPGLRGQGSGLLDFNLLSGTPSAFDSVARNRSPAAVRACEFATRRSDKMKTVLTTILGAAVLAAAVGCNDTTNVTVTGPGGKTLELTLDKAVSVRAGETAKFE